MRLAVFERHFFQSMEVMLWISVKFTASSSEIQTFKNLHCICVPQDFNAGIYVYTSVRNDDVILVSSRKDNGFSASARISEWTVVQAHCEVWYEATVSIVGSVDFLKHAGSSQRLASLWPHMHRASCSPCIASKTVELAEFTFKM